MGNRSGASLWRKSRDNVLFINFRERNLMDRSTRNWVIASALFVIVLWGSSPWLIPWWFSKTVGCGDGIESFGQFGDMLGFATSLFTGLTVIGLVLTIRLQQTQIK